MNKLNEEVKEVIEDLTGVEMEDNDGQYDSKTDTKEAEGVEEIFEAAKQATKPVASLGKNKLQLSKELMKRIPRPGESIYIVDRYPINDEEDPGKKSTICAYSLTPVTVMSSALSEDLKRVYVNGDIELPLQRKNTFQEDGKEIFADEDEAFNTWEERMQTSLEAVDQIISDHTEKKKFIQKAMKERNF